VEKIAFYSGCFLIVAIGVFFLAWAYCVVAERLEERKEKKHREAIAAARMEIGQDLIDNAYWLGENPVAMNTLRILGETLLKGFPEMWFFREKLWEGLKKVDSEL
jgi:hypothetical protein